MTNQAPPAIESVPVVQGDLDAVADYARDHLGWAAQTVASLRKGHHEWLTWPLVQAFAKYSLQHASPPGEVAGLKAALASYADTLCEGWCEQSGDCAHFDDCGGCLARRTLFQAGINNPTASAPTPAVGGISGTANLESIAGAVSDGAIRCLQIRDGLNRAIYRAIRDYRMGNMADEDGYGYPLVDLMSNPAPSDIGTGEMEMIALADEVAEAVRLAQPPVDRFGELVKRMQAGDLFPELHPVETNRHETWDIAQEIVGHHHSKSSLIQVVHVLLLALKPAAQSEGAKG